MSSTIRRSLLAAATAVGLLAGPVMVNPADAAPTTFKGRVATKRAGFKAYNPGAVIVAKPGDTSSTVLTIQRNLVKLGMLQSTATTSYYGSMTTAAVKKFQAARGLVQTGVVNKALYDLIAKHAAAVKAPSVKLDKRCMTGRTICINRTTKKMYWVIEGSVKGSWDIRTGRPGHATRLGQYKIYMKNTNWYSTLYHVNMPYTMFFDGGEAVHYSAEFARIGHSGPGSHGCVNMNKLSDAKWLYSQVRVGDKVIVTP